MGTSVRYLQLERGFGAPGGVARVPDPDDGIRGPGGDDGADAVHREGVHARLAPVERTRDARRRDVAAARFQDADRVRRDVGVPPEGNCPYEATSGWS